MSRLVVGTGRWHTYSLDGKRVPSVTGVIGKATGKPGLIKWSARLAAEWAATHASELDAMGEASWIREATAASDVARDAAAAAGTQLHDIARRLVYGQPVEDADPKTGEVYSDDVVRMGEQVARFMDRWDVSADTALVERPVFHESLRYAGTFDLVAVLRGGDRWLIDYKTGATGVWSETAYQATAYARATHVVIGDDIDMLMSPIARCGALWVRPDAWEFVPLRSDEVVWRAFRAMLAVAEVQSLSRNDMVGAALPVPEVA